MSPLQDWSFTIPLLLLVATQPTSASSNRTIDDAIGDSLTGLRPVYLPADGTWKSNLCGNCSSQPDLSSTEDKTYHSAMHTTAFANTPSVTMRFNGTAVYVFNIVTNNIGVSVLPTHLTFFLDGIYVGTYDWDPKDNGDNFLYSVAVYKNVSLPYAEHAIAMEASGGTDSIVLFDNIDNADQGSPVSPSSPSTTDATSFPPSGSSNPSSKSTLMKLIIGTTVGAATGLLCAAGALCYLIRKRVQSQMGVKQPMMSDAAKPDLGLALPVEDPPPVPAHNRPNGNAAAEAEGSLTLGQILSSPSSSTSTPHGLDVGSQRGSTVVSGARTIASVRAHLTALREEVSRLRDEQAQHFNEGLPSYDELA